MLAAGIDSELYRTVMFLHILAAIAGFGGVFWNALYANESKKRPGPGGKAITEATYHVGVTVAEKLIYLVGLTGLILVALSDGAWEWSDTWVWLSIVLFLASLALSHAVMIPGQKRILALLGELEAMGPPPGAGGPPPAGGGAPPVAGPPPQVVELEAVGKKLGQVGPILHLSLFAMLVLMIWKPGA